ncbi:potassium channel family protein [Allosalinactinospora lopnorensis]|uniref:potassium channel family protein n=1 Tax=Allosalinactinospora lopnorensis TaxID=1352348 RepID=UPI000623CEDA|nr:ion channel [Allosalinactinospora lopnorensis]
MKRRWNLGAFLMVLILLQFGFPVTLYGDWWTGLYMLLYAWMVVSGILTVRDERDRLVPLLVITPVFLVFGIWVAFDQQNEDARLGMLVSLGLFQVGLAYSLGKFIFRRSGAPGADLIQAAVCVYLLIGGVFAAVFSSMEILWQGSFQDTVHPETYLAWQQLTYFSYVTQATLGYGDILPVHPWARSLAALQAVGGTLFLATVIARIVGAYVAKQGTDEERPHE